MTKLKIMEISINKKESADAKILKIYAKVGDCFAASLVDKAGNELKDYDGYVPDFMPGNHYGDYIILDIDIESGVVVNWEKPSAEDIEEFVNGSEE